MLHVHPSVRYVQKAETCDVCLFPCLSVSSPACGWPLAARRQLLLMCVFVYAVCHYLLTHTHTETETHTNTHTLLQLFVAVTAVVVGAKRILAKCKAT